MRRRLFSIHTWLGLGSGIFLLAIGVSGSFLVYSNALDRLFYPTIYSIEPHGNRLSLDSMYSIINLKYGNDFITCSFDIPATKTDPVEFTLTRRQTNFHARGQVLVDVHPYTGAILRGGDHADISVSFVHWVMYFHNSFHAGRFGMLIVTIVSMTVFLSIITGLLYYGKRLKNVILFRLPLNKGVRFRTLHLYVGVWALMFNMIVCFTGFWMMKGTLSRDAWRYDAPRPKSDLMVSIDSSIAMSRVVLPGFQPEFVSIPYSSGDLIEIDGNMANTMAISHGDACRVVIDPETGKVVEAVDISKLPFPGNISEFVWPLHIGNYGGNFLKIMYVFGGLTPGILGITGFVMWWRRRGQLGRDLFEFFNEGDQV